MSQRIHLAWASVSLAMVGVGFGLGTLEAEPAESTSASPQPTAKSAPLASPLASAPPLAEVTSRALAHSPAKRPAPVPKPAPSEAPPASSPPMAQSVPDQQTQPPPLELGPALVLLDPDAEALIRILIRLRLKPAEETLAEAAERRRNFVESVVRDLTYSLQEEQLGGIYVALAALLPSGEYWQNSGIPFPPGLLETRRSHYEQNPTPENLERLVSLLDKAEPESLDKRWLEHLARANPQQEDLQELFARIAPGRAESVFAQGGLTLRERELLVDVVGSEDGAAGARLALKLLLESNDTDHLVSALEYDPASAAAFLRERQGDPVWEEVAAMAKLQHAYHQAEDQAQTMSAVAKYWRQLSPQRLPSVLSMLEDESWTPLESEILEAILASGDQELISDLPYYLTPPAIRWKLQIRSDRLENDEDDEGWDLEVERFLNFLDEAPFAARASLEDFYRVLPQPSSWGSFRLAASFQEKGDLEVAKSILKRARESKLTTIARAQLEAGLSLSDLDEEELEGN